jgi:hypothetical protein
MPILLQRYNLSKEISDRATLNVSNISLCTGYQIRRSWMRWNQNVMELMIFNFFLLVHVLPGAQNRCEQKRWLTRFGGGDAQVCNSLGAWLLSSRFKFHAMLG